MATLPIAQIQNDVAGVFLSYFQRAPEFEAMQWYSQRYIQLLAEQGNDPAARDNAYKLLSDQIYLDGTGAGEVPPANTIGNAAYVNLLYQNLLGREGDASGAAYWTEQLNTGAIARGELVAIMLESALGEGGRDAAWVANHLEVAVAFAQWQNSNPQILPSLPYDAAQVLAGVTEDPATVAEAFTKLYSYGEDQGTTFTLTPQIDEITGTDRNDTFNAVDVDPNTSAPNTTTLTAFDQLNGAEGLDTLNIFANGTTGTNDGVPDTARIQNIEIVNIINQGVDAAQHLTDASVYEGITQLWQLHGAANVSELEAGTTAGFRAFNTLAAEVGAAATASTINLAIDHPEFASDDRGTWPAILAQGESLHTVNVAGTLGGGAYLRLEAEVADGADTLFVNSEIYTVVLDVQDASGRAIANIDARGSTGDIGFRLDQVDTHSWGGAGDDTFNFDQGMLTIGTHVDGGGGYNEVLLHEESFQTQDYDLINGFENIQRLAFGSEYTTFDAAELSQYEDLAFVQWVPNRDIDNHANIYNLGAHQTLSVDQGIVAELTLANAAADVSAHVARDGWLDLWIAVGEEGATGGTLTLTGEQSGDVDFDNTWGRNLDTGETEHLEQGKFAVIDASELMGSLTLWDMAPELAETVHLGDGSENFVFLDILPGAGESSSSIGRLDTITGFDTEGASLVGLGDTREHIELDPNVTTLNDAWAAAAAAWAETSPDVITFYFEGDTYLYADTIDPGAGRYDNEDFGLRVTGEHDLA